MNIYRLMELPNASIHGRNGIDLIILRFVSIIGLILLKTWRNEECKCIRNKCDGGRQSILLSGYHNNMPKDETAVPLFVIK